MPILSTFLTQLKCALEIFKSNSLRHPHLREPKTPADSVARDSISSPDSSPSEKGLVPFKVLLIGRTVAVSFNASKDHMTSHDHLNDLTSSYEDVQSDSCNGAVTPILHVLLYNPLLTIQMDQECSKSEMSCFNMAALYSHQLTSVCECTYIHCIRNVIVVQYIYLYQFNDHHNHILLPVFHYNHLWLSKQWLLRML